MTVAIVSFGGGTDSTGMLVEMVRRGEPPPHAILFADTGGEHPHTYAHIATFSTWLAKHGYPAITTVAAAGETLEANCLRRHALPSIAYGFKTCSQRWKLEPQEKWANNDPACRAAWDADCLVTRIIGFEYGEERRRHPADRWYANRYPLIEWQMDRDDCKNAIERAGLKLPGKSACFFCPSSRKVDVRSLQDTYPDLLERALAMEANADLTNARGLGRRWAWADLIAHRDASPELPMDMPCDCYDGAAE
jgi:hypothetical protein